MRTAPRQNEALIIRARSIYFIAALLLTAATATNVGPYSSRLGPYYLVLLIGVCGLLFVLRAKDLMPLAVSPAFVWGGVLQLSLVVAALISKNGQDLQLLVPMASGLLIYVAVAWFVPRFISDGFAFNLIVGVPLILAIMINLYEFGFNPNILSTAPGRAAGFFENPNTSGAMIGGLWGMWLISRPLRTWTVNIAVGILSLGGTLSTFSRSALICFFIITLLSVGILMRRQRGSIGGALGFVLALGLLTGTALSELSGAQLSQDAGMRVDSLMEGRFDDGSSIQRGEAAQEFLDYFLEHPFTGLGPFRSLQVEDGQGPHNTFLALGVDFGIAGLLGFLSLLVIGVVDAQRGRWSHEESGIQIIIITWLMVTSLFSHNVVYSPQGSMMIGLLLGSVAASRKRARIVPVYL